MTDAAIIERPMVTAAGAAEMLGLSKRQVYDYAAKGQLPCYRFGSAVRFDAADIDTFKCMECAEMRFLRAVWQNSSHTFA